MRVDFFFGPGSRYSYLASTQIRQIAEETGATFAWRPLFSGDLIARAGGRPKSPQDPSWRRRDASRWARHYGVPYIEPEGPADWRFVAHACVAAARMGQGEPFGQAVLNLAHGQGVAPDNSALLRLGEACGLDPERFRAQWETAETAAAHEQNLRDALAAGAFGVPTFVTPQGVAIWGQDRLPLLKDCLLMGDVATHAPYRG